MEEVGERGGVADLGEGGLVPAEVPGRVGREPSGVSGLDGWLTVGTSETCGRSCIAAILGFCVVAGLPRQAICAYALLNIMTELMFRNSLSDYFHPYRRSGLDVSSTARNCDHC